MNTRLLAPLFAVDFISPLVLWRRGRSVASVCVVLASVFVLSTHSQAQDVYLSALAKTESNVTPASSSLWWGFSFKTDASTYSLDEIDVVLRNNTAGLFRAQLFKGNSSGIPTGDALTDFTYSSIGSTLSAVEFAPVSAVTLNPSSTYIFVMSPTSGTWSVSKSSLSSGYDRPAGGSWTLLGDIYSDTGPGTTWYSAPVFYTRSSIAATAIPEPSTTALLAGVATLAGVFLVRRLNRNNTRTT